MQRGTYNDHIAGRVSQRTHTLAMAGLSVAAGQAAVDHVRKVGVLQGGRHALLVIQLLVDCRLRRMRPRRHHYVHLFQPAQRLARAPSQKVQHGAQGSPLPSMQERASRMHTSSCMQLRAQRKIVRRDRNQQQRTLKRLGSVCMSFTRRHSPMSVARLQCCTVGVNCTLHASSSSRPHASGVDCTSFGMTARPKNIVART